MENHGVPIEIFLRILQMLPHQQLLIAKRVNKTWYSIITWEFQFDQLALSGIRDHFQRRWYPSYEFVSLDCLVKTDSLALCSLKQHNFLKLKHLHLYAVGLNSSGIGGLVNHLDRLETLELVRLSNNKEDHLVLDSLRTLNIDESGFHHLIVDCPALVNLRIILSYSPGLANEIEFKHPKSVKSLGVERLRSDWVETFSELEKLSIEHIYNIGNRLLQGN